MLQAFIGSIKAYQVLNSGKIDFVNQKSLLRAINYRPRIDNQRSE